MQTMTPVFQLVEQAKGHAQRHSKQLLHTFSFVPDDKLNTSPSSDARTPLEIVAHCGVTNGFLAMGIRDEMPSPVPTPEEAMAMGRERAKAIKTRQEAINLVEASTKDVCDALDAMTPEKLASSPNSPFGAFPMMFWMFLPGNHMLGHGAQVDYLQTTWGDTVPHFAHE